MPTMQEFFGEPIDVYTRKQAIEDGCLVDGWQDEFIEISRQHYKWPIAFTSAVFGLMQEAVEDDRLCCDYKGIWHDILYMSRMYQTKKNTTGAMFEVLIAAWDDEEEDIKQVTHTMKILCGPGDEGEPVLTVMLKGED